MRKLFGPEREEVTREWRILHQEELYDLYCSSNIIRAIKKNEIGGACGKNGIQERSLKGFGGEI